mgnify:CR=1 FL=1
MLKINITPTVITLQRQASTNNAAYDETNPNTGAAIRKNPKMPVGIKRERETAGALETNSPRFIATYMLPGTTI